MSRLKVAIIGCGAVTQMFHLPALAANDRVELTALVDQSGERAARLAEQVHAKLVTSDYREAMDEAEAAIVAVPNHLHASVSLELMRQRLHVLVEKPMALGHSDCEAMIETARSQGVVLAVGLVRRFTPAAAFVKSALERNLLGQISRFDFREGAPYGWQVTSDAPFRVDTGGGLLADIGVHVLDLLLWWLGDFESVKYADDALGGVEAECEIELTFRNGARGTVELSRTRSLRNTYILEGERGSLEVGIGANPSVTLHLSDHSSSLTGQVGAGMGASDRKMKDLFILQLEDFVTAVFQRKAPFVQGHDGARVIAAIDACRSVRRPLRFPWVFPTGALTT